MNTVSYLASAALALGAAGWMALPANAANATQQACSQQYQAAKTAGTLNGQKWTDFYSACAANMKSSGATTAAPAAASAPATKPASAAKPAVAAIAPTVAAPATGGAKAASAAPMKIAAGSGASTQQVCSGQYQAAKTAGTLNGQKWSDFYSACAATIRNYSENAAAAPAEPAPATVGQATTTPAAVATTDANGKPLSAGEIAFRQRIHACSQEWQSEKTAGTLPAGSKWPQFWSACNTQLKAQG